MGNFGDCILSCETLALQRKRFDCIVSMQQIDFNHISYFGSLLCATNDKYFLNKLIECGTNVNLIFKKDQTALSCLMWKIIDMYYESDIIKFNYLLDNGADINLGNIRTISGVQYIDRPKRIQLIQYFIGKGLDINNKLLYGDKMLYDTRLGRLIEQILQT